MSFRYYDDEYREHLRVSLVKANDEFFTKARREADARKALIAKSRGSVWGNQNGWVETYNLVVEHIPGHGHRGSMTCRVRVGDVGPDFEVTPEYGSKTPRRWFIRVKTELGYQSTGVLMDDYESAVQHAMVMALSVAYVEPLALAKKEAETEAKKKRVVKPKK